jgi:hypothetical protein
MNEIFLDRLQKKHNLTTDTIGVIKSILDCVPKKYDVDIPSPTLSFASYVHNKTIQEFWDNITTI